MSTSWRPNDCGRLYVAPGRVVPPTGRSAWRINSVALSLPSRRAARFSRRGLWRCCCACSPSLGGAPTGRKYPPPLSLAAGARPRCDYGAAAHATRRAAVTGLEREGRGHLFTFLDHSNIGADHNSSERDLRPTATYRKVTGGFRSEWCKDLFAHSDPPWLPPRDAASRHIRPSAWPSPGSPCSHRLAQTPVK